MDQKNADRLKSEGVEVLGHLREAKRLAKYHHTNYGKNGLSDQQRAWSKIHRVLSEAEELITFAMNAAINAPDPRRVIDPPRAADPLADVEHPADQAADDEQAAA